MGPKNISREEDDGRPAALGREGPALPMKADRGPEKAETRPVRRMTEAMARTARRVEKEEGRFIGDRCQGDRD